MRGYGGVYAAAYLGATNAGFQFWWLAVFGFATAFGIFPFRGLMRDLTHVNRCVVKLITKIVRVVLIAH